MKNEIFQQVMEEQLKTCSEVLTIKAKEYATDDRLHNFRIAAELKHETLQEALAGMMVKHTVSIYDMCKSKEEFSITQWKEKITDNMNYLILLKAIIIEQKNSQTKGVVDYESTSNKQ